MYRYTQIVKKQCMFSKAQDGERSTFQTARLHSSSQTPRSHALSCSNKEWHKFGTNGPDQILLILNIYLWDVVKPVCFSSEPANCMEAIFWISSKFGESIPDQRIWSVHHSDQDIPPTPATTSQCPGTS